jgi:hypothetical protein
MTRCWDALPRGRTSRGDKEKKKRGENTREIKGEREGTLLEKQGLTLTCVIWKKNKGRNIVIGSPLRGESSRRNVNLSTERKEWGKGKISLRLSGV